jgi:hypothetical protein
MATTLPNTIDSTASGASMSCHVAPTLPMTVREQPERERERRDLGQRRQEQRHAVGAPYTRRAPTCGTAQRRT